MLRSILTVLTLAAPLALGQADIADRLAPIREKHAVPALGAAVISGGEVIALGVSGLRAAGSPEAVAPADLWHLGSCTKAMTATLAAIYVEEGLIAWNTTMEQAFPELRESMHEDYRPVTIRQLLSHRAGIPADLNFDGLWGRLWNHPGTPQEQRWMLTSEILARPPLHAPGTKFLYANAGFAIAGVILERKAGRAWEDLLRERLALPLEMDDLGFGAPGSADAIDQPRGHAASGKPVSPGPGSDNPAAIGPGGTAHASLESWAKFIALHIAGARGESNFLRPETFTTLQTPAPGEDYALGWAATTRPWARGDAGPGRVLTHNGSNTMWFCVAWLAPEKDLGIIVTCNRGGESAARACDAVASMLVTEYGR